MKELTKEEIVTEIKKDALKALCDRYDRIYGEYPEHPHEGAAVYSYFLRLEKGLKF